MTAVRVVLDPDNDVAGQDPRNHPLLAPGSALYRALSDAGTVAYLPIAVMVFPVLHSTVSLGVEDHEPAYLKRSLLLAIKRLLDSYELLFGTVLATTAEDRVEAAFALRELHQSIQGHMPDGSRYHALNQEYWAYAWLGIFTAIIKSYEYARGYASEHEREDVLAGLVLLGQLFGVTGIADDWEGYTAQWDRFVEEVAGNTPATEFILAQLGPQIMKPDFAAWLPQPLWRLGSLPVRHFLRVGTLATFPEALDERLGLTRNRVDQWALRLHQSAWRLVPRSVSGLMGPAVFRVRQYAGTPVWAGKYSRQRLAARRAAARAERSEAREHSA